MFPNSSFTFTKDNSHHGAFTLAEVLITLGIIGVVAALTIPTLVANYNTKTWNTAATVFEKKLEESLKTMNTQSTLAGHTTTESFVEELSKHFKTNKICQNDKLLDCFSETVYWGGGDATPKEIDMSIIKTSKNFGLKEWGTNIVGVQFANGVNAMIAYNPTTTCTQDPFSNEITGINCLSILYDTSGSKNPNTSGKDLRNLNIKKLGSGCFAEINGICITTAPFKASAMTFEECTGYKATHTGTNIDTPAGGEAAALGISKCYYEKDYWAGAVKACGGKSNVPTMAQLAKIADYIYNTNGIGAKQDLTGLTFDTSKSAELGLNSSNVHLWSREESSPYLSYSRKFGANDTNKTNAYRYYTTRHTLCIDN